MRATPAACAAAMQRHCAAAGAALPLARAPWCTPAALVTCAPPPWAPRPRWSFLPLATVAAAEADATAADVSGGPAGASPRVSGGTPRTVVVTSFASLLPLVKRVVLKVHPDIVHAAGAEAVAVNEGSVRELFRLFDTLKQRCGGDDGAGAPPPGAAAPSPLKHRYDLSFFYYAPLAKGGSAGAGGGGGHELRRANVDIAVPPLFQERTAALEARGLAPQARSHWLGLAVDALTKLLAAVGLGAVVRPALAPEHQAVVDRAREQQQAHRSGGAAGSSGGRFRQADADGAMGALRRNLLQSSPLEQGKGDAFPAYGMATASVYSLKQRTARVLSLLATDRPGGGGFAPSAGLSPEQARRGFTALRRALIAHHDGLRLYHPLWPAVAVTLAPSGVWAALPAARSLTLPWDASEEEAVRFIQRAFPTLVAAAQAELPGRLARAQQQAAATAARKGGARKAPQQSQSADGRPRYRMHDGPAPAEGESWQRQRAAHRREGPRAQPPRGGDGAGGDGVGPNFDDLR